MSLIKKSLRKMISGVLFAVFALHIALIVVSIERNELSFVLVDHEGLSSIATYCIQFMIACWTGMVVPLIIQLLESDGPKSHYSVLLSALLSFSLYISVGVLLFGKPSSIFVLCLVGLGFALCYYWLVYVLEYVVLKSYIFEFNKRLEDYHMVEDRFLTEGESYDTFKKFKQ